MKILFLSPAFGEYATSLALALAREHDVLLVLNAVNAANELPSGFTAPPGLRLRIERLPHDRSMTTLFSNIARYWRLYRQFRPDVVLSQEEPKDYLVGMLALAWRALVVLIVHDPRPHLGLDARRMRWSRLRVYKRLLRWRANGVLVHGERMRSEALETGHFRRVPMMSMPHGPLGCLPGAPVQNFPVVERSCLFFGRIEAYKGLGVLIEAIELLHQRGVPAHAVIAGRGTDLARWRPQLVDSNKFTLIEKYLPADDVVGLFHRAQVVVLPYLEATQSGVAAYALGTGRPVVGTAVGSIGEMVRPGVNGLLVAPRDPLALADALAEVFADPAAARHLGQQSWALGQGALSWNTSAEVCRAMADACLGTRAPQPALRAGKMPSGHDSAD